jgi:two-component system, NtrC family, sensor histidine kinase AtoS
MQGLTGASFPIRFQGAGFMRLRTRLAVLFLVMLSIPIFGMSVLALNYSIDTMVGDLSRSADLLVQQIFEQMKLELARGGADPFAQLQRSATLRKLLDSSQAFGPAIVSASIIAPDGTIVLAAHGDGEGTRATELKSIAQLKDATSGWLPFAAIGEFWTADVYELRKPILANGRPLATVSVAVTTALMADRMRRLRLIVLSTAAAATIVAWILLSMVTSRIFLQLAQIARDFGKLAGADNGIELDGDEELASLSVRFNELSRRVTANRSQLASGGDHLFDVVRSIQDAVLMLDPSSAILFANQQARDNLAPAGEKMEGRTLKAVLGDDHPLVSLAASAIDAGVEAHDVPIELERGSSLLVSFYKLGHGRTPAGVLAILRDMRPVLELQTAVDYSNRLARLGALISGVAHQLRSPLQGMNLRLELLRSAGVENKERHIERMQQEIERLDNAVEALLRFMRPEQLKLTNFDLNQLVRELTARIGSERVQVEHKLADGLPAVRGDCTMLSEALTNVITNAVQAMPAGGTLTVSSRRVGAAAEVTIADTGFGIEKERLDHIFDLYYTTKPHGSGLGLALALRAVELNKGTIKIDSRVGEGTTCTISLPTAESLAGESAPTRAV